VSNTPSKASSLISGLRSGFSSGKGLSLGGKKKVDPIVDDKVQVDTTNQAQPQPVQPIQSDQTQVQPQAVQPQISQTEQLDTLSQVVDQVEAERVTPQADPLGAVAQAVPQVVDALHDPLNPPNPSPVGAAKKEALIVGSGVAVESPAPTVEHPGGVQTVEQERVPEISPEVESFLQHSKEQSEHLPQEIVVADNQEVSAVTHHQKKPVIVLPITEEEQKKGKNKSTKLSVRWLVEWSVKLMKKFSGKVIYREE
jgi:hypothetical protein